VVEIPREVLEMSRKEQIAALLQEDPDDPFLRYALAMEYVGSGEDETALEHFARLLEEHPEYVPGYLQMGQALVRLGRSAQARDCWQRGIAVARSTGDLHAAQEMEAFLQTL
jgi:tetratricopeptide (TPR) repeat protein